MKVSNLTVLELLNISKFLCTRGISLKVFRVERILEGAVGIQEQCIEKSFPESFPIFSGKVGKCFPFKMEMESWKDSNGPGKATGKLSV